MSKKDKKTKPRYESPVLVSLGALARGAGDCEGGGTPTDCGGGATDTSEVCSSGSTPDD